MKEKINKIIEKFNLSCIIEKINFLEYNHSTILSAHTKKRLVMFKRILSDQMTTRWRNEDLTHSFSLLHS